LYFGDQLVGDRRDDPERSYTDIRIPLIASKTADINGDGGAV
jgi:hypothetical protein